MILGTLSLDFCINHLVLLLFPHTLTPLTFAETKTKKIIFCFPPPYSESCIIYLCLFCFPWLHAWMCVSLSSLPLLFSVPLLTTEGKVSLLQTKMQNVLTGAARDKSEPGVWAKAGVQGRGETTNVNCMAQMKQLGLLTSTPPSFIPCDLLPFLCLFLSCHLFFLSKGLCPIRAKWIDFLFPSSTPLFFYLKPPHHHIPLRAQIDTVSACALG